MAQKFAKFFGGLVAERFRVTSLWGIDDENVFFFGSFVGPAVQQVNFVYFSSSLDQHCPPNTIDLRSRDRQPMVTPLHSGQGYVSVVDSAEEFISIHALGRDGLFVLSCGLPSHPLKIMFFARWETIPGRELSQLSTHQPPNVFLTEA